MNTTESTNTNIFEFNEPICKTLISAFMKAFRNNDFG